MALFEYNTKVDSTPELTAEKATILYGLLKEKGPSEIFIDPANESIYDWQHIQAVFTEAKQIERLANSMVNEKEVVTPAKYNEKTGELTQKEVKDYKYNSIKGIKEDIEADFLDVGTVVDDVFGEQTLEQLRNPRE